MKFRTCNFLISALILASFTSFKTDDHFINSRPGHEPDIKKESRNKQLRILVISDLNSSYGSTTYSEDVKAVINRIKLIKPDIILCGGDMVAGQKTSLTEENINDMWTGFQNTVLTPVSRLNIPFGFTVGNHDASPSFKTDRRLSEKFWKENAKATGLTFVDSAHYPFYYSYIKNNVFFISWDAAGAEIRPEVYEWMKSQLRSRIAGKARLRVLIGHLPLYAIVDSKNRPGEVNSDPVKALNFFKDQGLDLYISGHQHAYYPAQKEGIRFLNMGCIGDGPRKLIGNDAPAQKSYTIINVPVRNAGNFSYTTYTPQNNEIIDLKSLPDSVTGFNGISLKDRR